MIAEDGINQLKENDQGIIEFASKLDEKLMLGEIDLVEYQVMMDEKYPITNQEEFVNEIHDQTSKDQAQHSKNKKTRMQLGIAGAILVVIAVISIFSQQGPFTPTGFVIGEKQVQKAIDFNQAFSQYTETQLELGNITGLKISGRLEGAGARVKLRINGTDYLVADIINPTRQNQTAPEQAPQYIISTDKTSYVIGETVTVTVTPGTENKSLYVSYGEQTQILDANTYITQELGEYQAIALITLPDDILRIETNFTVGNESTNETTPIETPTPENLPEQTNTYEFSGLCTETCNIPESSSAILIIETSENSTVTITQITTTQNKENQAPEQTRVIADITQTTQETTTLDLNEYFSDPDNDTVQYDINEIPEIDAAISQNILTITSANPGTYTAYIYATDGDKLVTSNTFQITIITAEAENPDNQTNSLNETTNETINETAPPGETITEPPVLTDPCSSPDINQRPSYCFAGIEDKIYQDLSAPLENREGELLGRFNKFGNLIIKGLIVQEATGEPEADDFKIGYTETIDFMETTIYTAWISKATGNLYLRGGVREEQETLQPQQFDTFIIQNKLGIILAYFDERTGDLYIKGNIVQLGKI